MRIVLLFYINRSGSTFLGQQLSRFNEILVCPEADILANLLLVQPNSKPRDYANLLQQFSEDEKLVHWGIEPKLLQIENLCNFEIFKYLLELYREKVKPGARIILYKAERLFQLTRVLIPIIDNGENLSFLWLLRDLRAVYNSQKSSINPQTHKNYSTNPITTALYWNSYVRNFMKYQGNSTHAVYYENLITGYPKSIKSVALLLGADPGTLQTNGDLYSRMPENHLLIHRNIVNPPNIERIHAWRENLSENERQLLEISSKQILQKLNYECLYLQLKKPRLYFVFSIQYIKFHFIRLKNKVWFHLKKLMND